MNSMRVIEKPKDKAFTFNELNNFVKFPTEHTTCFSKKLSWSEYMTMNLTNG